MFHVEWILRQAQPVPESSTRRRPALLPKVRLGKRIEPAWPLSPGLRSAGETYPKDPSGLTFVGSAQRLPEEFGEPGSADWAVAVETIGHPTIAVRIRSDAGENRVHLLRAFGEPDGSLRVVGFDLVRRAQGRGKTDRVTIERVVSLRGRGDRLVESLREHLERVYLEADPNMRDRCLRADGRQEPVLLLISSSRDVVQRARAVAATFGATVRVLQENIASDDAALTRNLTELRSRLAAVGLCERSGDGALVWVSDRIRAGVDAAAVPVELFDSLDAAELQASLRVLMEMSEAKVLPRDASTLLTCRRCQPDVRRLIAKERLSVATVAAGEPRECVCGGSGYQAVSLRLCVACRLAEQSSVLVIGYQENFPAILASIRGVEIRHLRNAGDERAAAQRCTLAIVLPGSMMGHAESEPYIRELEAHGRRVIVAAGNQLSDAFRVLIDLAVKRNPALRS